MDKRAHQVEERPVIFKVARTHEVHRMQVRGKNEGIFINGAILHHGLPGVADIDHLPEPAV